MQPLPTDIAQLQTACGTRVILDDTSRIINIADKEMFDRCLIYSEAKSQKIKDSIKCQPMSADWKSDCKKNMFWFQDALADMKKMNPSMDSRLFNLRQKLLDFAGEAVCFPAFEEDLDNILSHGQFWVGCNAKLMCGEPSRCHANSANLWEQQRGYTHLYRICLI